MKMALSLDTSACAALPFNPTVAANLWAARVVSNGGAAPAGADVTALITFLTALNTAGLIGKYTIMNCLYPSSGLAGAMTPIPIGFPVVLQTNVNFVIGDLTVAGLLGDSATKYINTLVKANQAVRAGGVHLAAYITVNPATVVATEIGSVDGNGRLRLHMQGGNLNMTAFDDGTALAVASVGWTGYWSCDKTATNARALCKASSVSAHAQVATNALTDGASNTPSPNNIYVFGENTSGSPSSWTNKRMSYFAVGNQGFSTAESLAEYNAIQALRTSWGGGFI